MSLQWNQIFHLYIIYMRKKNKSWTKSKPELSKLLKFLFFISFANLFFTDNLAKTKL